MSTALLALCGTAAARPTVARFLDTLLVTGSSTRALCAAITTATNRARSTT